VLDPQRLEASLRLVLANLNQSEMALRSERMPQCARKRLDTADIVRDGNLTPSEQLQSQADREENGTDLLYS
jgi:hypothetical protein